MALATFLHLSGAIPACLTIRTPWGLRWTFLGFRCRLGSRHLWRVSIDPFISFPVFALLCSQRTLVVSCALLLANVAVLISRSNDRFCQFWHHVHWISAFRDELRKLPLGVLASVLSYVWCVPHEISLSHRWVLTLLRLADTPRCTLLLLTRPWKCVVSSLNIRFRNKFDLLTSSFFLSTQSTNHRTILSVLLTTFCAMLVPLLPKCFWGGTAFLSWRVNISQVGRKLLRQRIGQFSESFLLELLAQFHDRQWDYLCLHSSWVLGLKTIVFLIRKFSQLSLTCLFLGSATWLHRHFLSVSSNWIHLWWGYLWPSGRLRLLFEGFSDWL